MTEADRLDEAMRHLNDAHDLLLAGDPLEARVSLRAVIAATYRMFSPGAAGPSSPPLAPGEPYDRGVERTGPRLPERSSPVTPHPRHCPGCGHGDL